MCKEHKNRTLWNVEPPKARKVEVNFELPTISAEQLIEIASDRAKVIKDSEPYRTRFDETCLSFVIG